jgi:isopenicillin-N epimerase
VSHITSPTAVILPMSEICRAAHERGIAVCVDGPHAIAQIDLAIDSLDCDYYTASCHKWLSAPFGSGFLYVHPRRQESVGPLVQSWGRVSPTEPRRWDDEFVWSGTRDPSAFLSVPAAIEFLEGVGFEEFRSRTHALARYARERIAGLVGLEPLVPDSRQWYGSMAHVPLPPTKSGGLDARELQNALWREYGIEVPIVEHGGRRAIRVSCHLYNHRRDINRLVDALRKLL